MMMHSHRHCLLCGSENPLSMRLKFNINSDGSVGAFFQAHQHLQGYNGIMHGGVIGALLDSAMTNCLFLHGIEALTGEMNIKFLHSIPCNSKIFLQAQIEKEMDPLFLLVSRAYCDKTLMAESSAKFMKTSAHQ
jgi:acyl-coenzyme A thioesterase PaaI-like protein